MIVLVISLFAAIFSFQVITVHFNAIEVKKKLCAQVCNPLASVSTIYSTTELNSKVPLG